MLRFVSVLAVAGFALAAVAVPIAAQQSKRRTEPPLDRAALDATMPAPNACSTGYHGALAALAPTLAERFTDARNRLRSPLADLPATWMFAQPRAPLEWAAFTRSPGRGTTSEQPDRRCSELVVSLDGALCRVTAATSASFSSAIVSPAKAAGRLPAPDDRAQRVFEHYRQRGGVAPEALQDGRFYWPLERVAQDLVAYTSQPASPALCSGVPEMLDFLATHVALLVRRSGAVRDATRLAGEQALRAIEALPGADQVPRGDAEDASRMLVRLTRIALPAAAEYVIAEPSLAGRLEIIAAASKALPPAEAAVLRSAVARVEVFAFGSAIAARYARVDLAYPTALDAIRRAHRTHCTCGE